MAWNPLQQHSARAFLPLAALVLLAAVLAAASSSTERPEQAADCGGSPECLVRFMTGQSGPSERLGDRDLVDSAVELVRSGGAAIPWIQNELGSFQRAARRAPQALRAVPWLLYALARVQGPAAVSTLSRMLVDPRNRELSDGIDRAMAISLGLTSFRSSMHGAVVRRFLPRSGLPQEALDQLLLAWLLDDQQAFEASLTESAKRSALNFPAAWRTLRTPLVLSGSQPSLAAFGYRLRLPPGLTRDPGLLLPPSGLNLHLPDPDANPEGQALFFQPTGLCATIRVRFALVRDEQIAPGVFNWHYLVDAGDLATILRSIQQCLWKLGDGPDVSR